MGQAKKRGSFEERKEAGIKKKQQAEAKRVALEIKQAEIQRQWELEFPVEAAKRRKLKVLLTTAMAISQIHDIKNYR